MSLTIEPLTLDILASFKEARIHNGKEDTLEAFKDGLPPHQAVVLSNGVPVLLTGVVEHQDGLFWSYTLFSEEWKPQYYRFIIRYFKWYTKVLDFEEICHIIDKNKPWTRKMAAAFGFEYRFDLDGGHEWWSIKNGRTSINASSCGISGDAGYSGIPAK